MALPEANSCCCLPGASINKKYSDDMTVARGTGHSSAAMLTLTGGWFRMGANDNPHPDDGEAPERDVFVDSFTLAATAVTINEFSKFVQATGYCTVAERHGVSFVFHAHCDPNESWPAAAQAPWWRQVAGACWHSPDGSWRAANTTPNDPVTHIAHDDALAYCRWSNTRLPTEAEWEYAARGPHTGQPFPWGDTLECDGSHRANVWQGEFPDNNNGDDGYAGVAPVDAYGPQGFGHYNMIGNVWEWVADRFTSLHTPRATRNPQGPLNGSRWVAKGGSYLCHASYCTRYRTSSRQALPADTTTGNVGFRVAADD